MKQFFTVFFLAFSFTAFAQQSFDFRQKTDIKVVVGTDTLRQAWAGGLNAPIYSKIDLNQDGTEDLYAFDRMNNKSFTFLAVNTGGTWQWKYAPEYETLFPDGLELWVLLRDYDGDGKKDLFTGTSGQTYVYRNITPANGPLTFVSNPRHLKFDTFANMPFGAYVLPAITDVDNDGDLDILVFENNAAETIEYYRNLSKDQFNNLDSLKFTRSTSRWGNFNRCGFSSCNSFVFGSNVCRVAGTKHGGGASILALDLDNDLDKDILVGSDLCADLVRLTNKGTAATANMDNSSLILTYPNTTNPASMVNLPAAFYEDVTFDGKKDLLVSPFQLDNMDKPDLNHSSWLYQNNAASATVAPNFGFVKNNFLQDNMIDLGYEAIPVFADIDADGDQDLLVGNYADYRGGATVYKSTVTLFTNVGTATKPVFKLTDPDYLQFSQSDFKGISLQFADMNGDGSKDMVVKYLHSSGSAAYLAFIPNTAQPNQPFSFSRANLTAVGIGLNTTDSPFLYDIDSDGDQDILLGTDAQNGTNVNSGAIQYYKRVGANAANFSSWQLINDNVGNIPRNFTHRSTQPFILDLNNDNKPELITADNSGEVIVYADVLTNLGGNLVGQNNLLFNAQQNAVIPTALGFNLHVAATDLDGDQKPEMIVGTNGGGLIYLKNQSGVLGVSNEMVSNLGFNVYPNPASETLKVSSHDKVAISVFDMTGKKLLESNQGLQKEHEINIAALKPGVYFLKVSTSDFRSAGRTFVVQH